MLILTRRVGESIVIGEDVVVTILKRQGQQARIGIVAPADLSIYREEIYSRNLEENSSKN